MKRLTVYFDMDGVLADFDRECKRLNHLYEQPWLQIRHFFYNLMPIENDSKEAIRVLKDLGYEVKVLTKVDIKTGYGYERAIDKIEWIEEYFGDVFTKEDVIIVPIEDNKFDYIKTDIKNSVLIDDYKGNLTEWKKQGGIAIKYGKVFKPTREYHQVTNFAQAVAIIETLEKAGK